MSKFSGTYIKNRLLTGCRSILRFVSSPAFFYIGIALFLAQAILLACTEVKTMLFDEAFHLRIIDFYTNQITPFVASQGSDTANVGDLTRNTSYLYHYLMSFPARVMESLGFGVFDTWSMLLMRLINVAIFVVGLIFSRKVLREIGFGNTICNLSVLAIAMLPNTIYLAATVNYDSLFMLAVFVHLLYFIRILKALRKDASPEAYSILIFLISAMVGSLTKYAFLPIALISTTLLVIVFVAKRRKTFKRAYFRGFLPKGKKYPIIIVSVVAAVLFGLSLERYGGNIVTYGTPLPDCAKVQSVQFCSKWAPWQRNYTQDETRADRPFGEKSLVYFIGTEWWKYMQDGMLLVGSPTNQGVKLKEANSFALWVIGIVAPIVIGLFLFSIWAIRHRLVLFVSLIAIFYCAMLILTSYGNYINTNYVLVAGIQFRYIIWIAPFVLAVALGALAVLINKLYAKSGPIIMVSAMLVVALTYTQIGFIPTYYNDLEISSTRQSLQPLNGFIKQVAERFLVTVE